MKRYYIAYGSNLNIPQMRMRCPKAVPIGTALLKGWELLFKGSLSGSYLTIEEAKDGTVPVAIWEITPSDEAALDRYEGYPSFYYKREIPLFYKGLQSGRRKKIGAFAYIMHEERPIGVPSDYYVQTCLEGYDTFGFDKRILMRAYENARRLQKMNDNITRMTKCPKCGKIYKERPALSRVDNKTLICSECGTREALESIGVSGAEQDEIINTIHKNS